MSYSSKKVFTLEGNIGCGKSTFLTILKNNLKINAVYEPLDKWQNIAGHNLLEKFYQDMPRWAYTMQSYAFISRIKTQLDSLKIDAEKDIQILDRSVFCDRYCFAKNCFELGSMSSLEWEIYKEWFNWLVGNYIKYPDGIIYLRTSPQTCNGRMKKRSRQEESPVPLDYLKLLHQKHEDWLIHKKEVEKLDALVPVLILDCDKEFEVDMAVQKDFIKQVEDFFVNSQDYIPKQVKESSKSI